MLVATVCKSSHQSCSCKQLQLQSHCAKCEIAISRLHRTRRSNNLRPILWETLPKRPKKRAWRTAELSGYSEILQIATRLAKHLHADFKRCDRNFLLLAVAAAKQLSCGKSYPLQLQESQPPGHAANLPNRPKNAPNSIATGQATTQPVGLGGVHLQTCP